LIDLTTMMKTDFYTYKAKCTDVYDGDTVTLDIDLGFGLRMVGQKIRLLGINTPEIRGSDRAAGLVSAERLRGLIEGRDVIMVSHKDRAGKYGRWLATIYINEVNVNNLLLDEGLAIVYE
jgi:micrococcal nuclease